MPKIIITAVENQSEITGEYVAYEWQGYEVQFTTVASLQPYLPNDDLIRAWKIPPEYARYWTQYDAKADGDTLTLSEKTAPKKELGRRLFGEVQNNHRIAKIIRQLVAVHLRHTTSTGHLVDEDNDLWLDIERESQRADIINTLYQCLPPPIAGDWLANKTDYLDFFHEVSDLYHNAVFRGDETANITWAEFSARQYGGGRSFDSPSDLMSFYNAVIAQCEKTNIDGDMTPADFVRDVVFSVAAATSQADGEPNHPSVAPKLEVDLTTDANNICVASAAGDNISGAIVFQWQERTAGGEWTDIPGETSALFDYTGHSGELRVTARAPDYIGGEVSAHAEVVKIA